MQVYIVANGPNKGNLRIQCEKGDRRWLREREKDNDELYYILSEILEDYRCNGSFDLLTDHDIANLNDAGYTSIFSDDFFIGSEDLTFLQDDQGNLGFRPHPDNKGEYVEDVAKDLDAHGYKIWHFDWTFDLPTEVLRRTGKVDFIPVL